MSNSAELLKGKKVVVIGGSSGIGFSVAAAALANGATVVISSSSDVRVASAVSRLGGDAGKSVSGSAVDVRDESKLFAFLDNVGVFDHLVWTAGENLALGYPDVDLSQLKGAFDIVFWAVAAAAKHIYEKKLIPAGGSITLTTGIVHQRPGKGWSVIAGRAGALVSFTRGLAVDLAPIRVNIISPGYVNTDVWAGMDPAAKEAMFKSISEKLLIKHIASPDEIAEAYIFAMKCSYFTGQMIDVDGGALLV
ncbi:hypothetical protein BOTBODRAFT_169234 [Botryobasidium botryosum FD-172 SS1]|uniref:Uncharacterized protein n=1 Tax=Botryobasidium botryosum (strain FD-172 SS1) TaxID=930990 RepID=A0A067N0K5_BOTB1|nr:hypothetical protein BOTBODRAFT_169234 [Botryobasidium botryosum FD-172 SS1]